MQQLTSKQLVDIVGGNLVTGWVPRNWPGVAGYRDFQISSTGVGASVPGVLSPSIQVVHPNVTATASMADFWRC